MTTELQNKAWFVLPKEFKEEVKQIFYTHENNEIKAYLIHIFGDHNLTSDTEGEEMLIVSRKEIQHFFKSCIKHDERMAYWDLLDIFGSKCLPDEESKPAKPKENVNLSQETANCDKQFDNILKDSFSKERRLNIATQMVSAYIHCEGMTDPSYIATVAFQLADALIAESEKEDSK